DVAEAVPQALLRLRAVQAVGGAERAEGITDRLPFAPRRLACALGRQRARVARRTRRRTARGLASRNKPGSRRIRADSETLRGVSSSSRTRSAGSRTRSPRRRARSAA